MIGKEKENQWGKQSVSLIVWEDKVKHIPMLRELLSLQMHSTAARSQQGSERNL
jgi:hypothetical protein